MKTICAVVLSLGLITFTPMWAESDHGDLMANMYDCNLLRIEVENKTNRECMLVHTNPIFGQLEYSQHYDADLSDTFLVRATSIFGATLELSYRCNEKDERTGEIHASKDIILRSHLSKCYFTPGKITTDVRGQGLSEGYHTHPILHPSRYLGPSAITSAELHWDLTH